MNTLLGSFFFYQLDNGTRFNIHLSVNVLLHVDNEDSDQTGRMI